MNYILGAINPEQMINKQLSLSTHLSAQAGGAATLAMTSSYMAGRRQCRRKMNQSTRSPQRIGVQFTAEISRVASGFKSCE